MNPLYYIDFYKVGHVSQYPTDTEYVWANWTPRTSRIPTINAVAHVGLQRFIKTVLMEAFDKYFFARPLTMILAEYREIIHATLGVENPRTDHIQGLWWYGHLPIKIYSLPEGTISPIGVPSLVMVNTEPWAFWLPNYLETMLSAELWLPSTSATLARSYRDIFTYWAKGNAEDLAFVDWQGHDFSMRGMGGIEAAKLSGLGHLTCFSGTDTIPAILDAHKYYSAPYTIGGSVPATEHSVMMAGGQADEFDTFRRLITEIYPTGIVSIVSDTWDLWKVLTNFIPRLKDVIHARTGKIVIRPDSGDPVKIIVGDPDSTDMNARMGVASLLGQALGTRDGLIQGAGMIYGDAITPERANAILKGLADKGLRPSNMVFGIGSYTYQYKTRDTFGFAMKATAVQRGGKLISIFKDPVTDDGGKKSALGIPCVYQPDAMAKNWPAYYLVQECLPEQLDRCAFQKVYENGRLLVDTTWAEVRGRVRA